MLKVPRIGRNPGHDNCIEEIYNVSGNTKRLFKFNSSFFKTRYHYFNDLSAISDSAKKSSRKSQKRKTSFSIRSGLLSKRKGSHAFDPHALEEERSLDQSESLRSRQIIPEDRGNVRTANLRESIIPTLSSRVEKSKDSNFAWID